MSPCPSINLGTEDIVPIVPGFVNETVAPVISSTLNLLLRALDINESYSEQNSLNERFWACFILGTTSILIPSLRVISTAKPILIDACLILCGIPSFMVNASFI